MVDKHGTRPASWGIVAVNRKRSWHEDMAESPTQQLRHEHELVLIVVAAMEREVAALRAGHVHSATIEQMVDFTRNFTDGCHHAKEEKLLFPLLEQRSPAAGGPVSVMLSEHMAGREAVRAIADNLPGAESSEASRVAVADNLALYADLLRMHIHKENEVLFPMADRILSEHDQRRLGTEFERVEAEETGEGVHEKYHRLAHVLAAGNRAGE